MREKKKTKKNFQFRLYWGVSRAYFVQCIPLYTYTLANHFFQGTRKTRTCLTGHPVYKNYT